MPEMKELSELFQTFGKDLGPVAYHGRGHHILCIFYEDIHEKLYFNIFLIYIILISLFSVQEVRSPEQISA